MDTGHSCHSLSPKAQVSEPSKFVKCRRPLSFPARFSTILCPRSWLILPCQIRNLLMKVIFSLICSCGICICIFAVTLAIRNVTNTGSSSENPEEKEVIFIDHVGKPIWEELLIVWWFFLIRKSKHFYLIMF